jgi:acid phosphatase
MNSLLLLIPLSILLLVGAPGAVAEPPAPPTPIVPPPVQPANIGDLKTEAIAYYDSGAYLTDLIAKILERKASGVELQN